MDHVVYVDAKENELEKLLAPGPAGQPETSRMIVRGATGRKLPHGRVSVGDRLFFIRNNGEGLVRAQATVTAVYHSEKLSEEESRRLIEENQPNLQLSTVQIKRWAGKRYLVLVTVADIRLLAPFAIDRSAYGNMDDWLPVGDIQSVAVREQAV